MRISDELIKEIRSNTDIVELIRDYNIPLIKKGKNLFGVCPFHDDHSPSMSVDPTKQIYKCFSCGAGGNVYTFVMEYENVSFTEAVRLLGTKLGYNLDNVIKQNSLVNNKEYIPYEIAHKYYQNNLYTKLGENAINYLSKRNIDNETIKKFGIGLALNESKLTKMLISKKYSITDLVKLGLTTENGADFFLNRIIFPIWDISGRVVAFSGRIYNTTSSSKYVNTKETPIFKKGNLLYNYHNAKMNLKKSEYIIVMEGFMDVIRASTIGITNAVATLGTAVTKEQISLIKKISDNVILMFDGDKAGEKATLSCIPLLEDANIIPKIVRLPYDLDPDEYILKYGEQSFKNYIENPLSLTDFKLLMLKESKNLNEIDDVATYLNEAIEELVKEKDSIKVDLILNKLSKEFNANYNSLKDNYNILKTKYEKESDLKNKLVTKINIPKTSKIKQYTIAEKSLIYYMIKYNEVITMVENRVAYMPDNDYRNLSNEIIYYYHKFGKIIEADFYTHLIENNKKAYTALKEINTQDLPETYTIEAIDDYIMCIKKANIKQSHINIKNKLQEEKDVIEKAKIANKKFSLN